jgi:hypothetical protein
MNRALFAVASAALVACSQGTPDVGQTEAEVRRAPTLHARGGGFISVAARGRHLWFGDRFGWVGFLEMHPRVHLTGGFVGHRIHGIDVRDDAGNSGTGRNLVFLTTGGEQVVRISGALAWWDSAQALRGPLVQVTSTAGGLAFSDRVGTANVLIDWEVRPIECGCRDIVLDQVDRGPDFHFYGSNPKAVYPSEDACNEALNEPGATAGALEHAREGPKSFCETAYECVDEECQSKDVLYRADRPPFCHCIQKGEDGWLIECEIHFVDCCCDPPETDAGTGDGGSDGGRDGGEVSDGGSDAGSGGGDGGATSGARSGGS